MLKWDSDGSNLLTWADPTHAIACNSGKGCLRYTNGTWGMDDVGCDSTFYYICEFQCTATAITTTPTNTSTHHHNI